MNSNDILPQLAMGSYVPPGSQPSYLVDSMTNRLHQAFEEQDIATVKMMDDLRTRLNHVMSEMRGKSQDFLPAVEQVRH
jgi:hypothetical protein